MKGKKPPMDDLGKARWDEWHGAITEFLKSKMLTRIANLGGRAERNKKKYAVYSDRKHSALLAIIEFEERLQKLITSLENQSFDGMFAQILSMEGVRALRILGTKMVIETKRIFQEVDGERFDVGQWIIEINIGNEKHSRQTDIAFISGPYRGKYIPTHPQEKNTCFGSNFNDPINKLLGDLNLVTLVHLLLSFLRHETTRPSLRKAEDIVPYDEALYEKGYESETEKTTEQQTFTALIKSALIPRKTALLRKELKRNKTFFKRATAVCLNLRQELQSITVELNEWNMRFANRSNLATDETRSLFEAAQLYNLVSITYKDDMLHIGFFYQKPPTMFKTLLTLTLTPLGVFKLLGVMGPLHPLQRLVSGPEGRFLLEPKDLGYLTKQLNTGLAPFIREIITFLRGWKAPQTPSGMMGGSGNGWII